MKTLCGNCEYDIYDANWKNGNNRIKAKLYVPVQKGLPPVLNYYFVEYSTDESEEFLNLINRDIDSYIARVKDVAEVQSAEQLRKMKDASNQKKKNDF